jgi:transcriptional regulator with XRE-family HTH domain
MLRAVHARMARAALEWSLRDLQEKTGVNKNTLARFESGKGVLLSTAIKIEEVFVSAGITFLYEEGNRGPGIIVSKVEVRSPNNRRTRATRSAKRSQKHQ